MDYPNVDPMAAAIITDGKATLHELRTIYTLEDGFNLWEIVAVNRYNEWAAMEAAKKKQKG